MKTLREGPIKNMREKLSGEMLRYVSRDDYEKVVWRVPLWHKSRLQPLIGSSRNTSPGAALPDNPNSVCEGDRGIVFQILISDNSQLCCVQVTPMILSFQCCLDMKQTLPTSTIRNV